MFFTHNLAVRDYAFFMCRESLPGLSASIFEALYPKRYYFMHDYPFSYIYAFSRASYRASLPFYRSVKLFLLFGGTQPQVNCRGIQAFVTENIRQQRNVLVFFQKKYGK